MAAPVINSATPSHKSFHAIPFAAHVLYTAKISTLQNMAIIDPSESPTMMEYAVCRAFRNARVSAPEEKKMPIKNPMPSAAYVKNIIGFAFQ